MARCCTSSGTWTVAAGTAADGDEQGYDERRRQLGYGGSNEIMVYVEGEDGAANTSNDAR